MEAPKASNSSVSDGSTSYFTAWFAELVLGGSFTCNLKEYRMLPGIRSKDFACYSFLNPFHR